METKNFDYMARLILEDSGICFAGRRKAALKGHLEQRVRRLALPDLASYCELFQNRPEERRRLYDLVTVNETSFFRNPAQFEDLKSRIIPALEEEKGRLIMRSWGEPDPASPQSFRKLRILCAGCSTGEEPYSVAMTLLDALRYPLAWDIEILAGDLSESCLRRAREGRYEEARLQGMAPAYRERFIRMDAEGGTVTDEVKGLVRFTRLNLARILAGERFPGVAEDFGGFDVVFCRNVMIYFPAPTQQLLVDALQQALVPGGYLFTGDAEPLHLYRHRLDTVAGAASLIYRKPGVEAGGAEAGGAGDWLRRCLSPVSEVSPLSVTGGAETGGPESRPRPASLGTENAGPLTAREIRELLFLVSDASAGFRQEALRRLVSAGIDAVYPELEAAVANDGNANLRNGAMELLVCFGQAALPGLLQLLEQGNDEVRNFSTVMLGSIGSRAAVPHLIRALRDPDLNVRHGAAEALGRIGDGAALEPLLELLDQGFWLQYPAISALGAIGSPRALPRLLDFLDDDLLFEPAAQALGKIGDRRALPGLVALMNAPDERRAGIAAQVVSQLQQGIGAQSCCLP